MKPILLLLTMVTFSKYLSAQSVGIGIASPNSCSVLQISSTTKGLLIPTMTTSQMYAIPAPANGLLVYNSSIGELYQYNGTVWRAILNGEYWSRPITNRSRITNATDSIGLGTNSPLALLHVAQGSVLFSNTGDIPATQAAPPLSGTGRRMMWYADKAAFRAGYVNGGQWNKDSIGNYSTAFGDSVTASGISSFATGRGVIASGIYATAAGSGTIASGAFSVAAGTFTTATGSGATAFGANTVASNTGSFASGVNSIASGLYSTATGYNSTASGSHAIALGNNNNAAGYASFAAGMNNAAAENYATTIGYSNVATGYSTAIGYNNTASAEYATALGSGTVASGQYATATGRTTMASGQNATAIGLSSVASGIAATATGYSTTASGNYAMAMGYNSRATGLASFSAGYLDTASGSSSTAAGYKSKASGDYSTALGYGSIASGESSTAIGRFNTASGFAATALGNLSIAIGDGSIAAGTRAKASSYGVGSSFAIGEHVTASHENIAIGYYIDNDKYGSCLIADRSGSASYQLYTQDENHMMMRFANGYELFTNTACTIGAKMFGGANSWSTISDSTKKENFKAADGNYFLKKIGGMKLGSWNYKSQDKKRFRHYGPMAQEFYSYFGNDGIGVIGNDTAIASADMDGVIMIALQALIKEKDTLKSENEVLKKTQQLQTAEITGLKEKETQVLERLQKLEAVINKQLVVNN